MTHRWQAILFDFDYTLADSSPGIIACVNDALEKMRLPMADPKRIRNTIGLTLAEAFTSLTGIINERDRAEFTSLFVNKADEVMVDATTLFQATHTVIPALAKLGYRLGIVSTKYRARLEGVLKRESLLCHVDVIVGGDQVTYQKPAPDGLLLAAEMMHLHIARCLYVGDALVDASAAAAAGMAFVGVLSGVTAALSFGSETILLPGLAELPAWLQTQELVPVK